jgi:threonylcarbamoyladenosine tRNA methylthiotransferase MtaB
MTMNFSITTLGCKVNQYESAGVATALQRAGLTPSNDGHADLVVINTCCITTTAMRKSRQAIRKAIRTAGDPVVLIAGCYSDYSGKNITEILSEAGITEDRAVVVGHHGDVAEAVAQAIIAVNEGKSTTYRYHNAFSAENLKERRKIASGRKKTSNLHNIDEFHGHQRAFVKIQDGCDAFCTYCVVPFTRPNLTSRPIPEIRDECRRLIDAGHREIVLTGVFIGAFGRPSSRRKDWDHPHHTPLAELVDEIAPLPGLWKVRLSSIEPADVTSDLIRVAQSHPTFAPHFHLPLQSGSQDILQRMNRQYTALEFRDTVIRLRDAFENPALTADIIVAFPGETDDDFQATLAMARFAKFSKIHAFPFSAIEGTAAWQWRKQTPKDDIVKARLAELARVESELASNYHASFIGQTLEGLVEAGDPDDAGRLGAMTDRYMTVRFAPTGDITPGQIRRFIITDSSPDGLIGSLAD